MTDLLVPFLHEGTAAAAIQYGPAGAVCPQVLLP